MTTTDPIPAHLAGIYAAHERYVTARTVRRDVPAPDRPDVPDDATDAEVRRLVTTWSQLPEVQDANAAIARAQADLDAAADDLTAAIVAAIRSGTLQVGDRLPTPSSDDPLTVIVGSDPDHPDLAAVVLTADGGQVIRDVHSVALDDNGDVIDPGDEPDPVLWEQWWGGGCSAVGLVHALTRRLILV